MVKHTHWAHFWWAILQHFGRECKKTWGGEVIAVIAGGVAGAGTTYLRSHGQVSFVDVLIDGLLTALLFFGIYVFVHFLRSPWLERKSEGLPPSLVEGLFGAVLFLMLCGGSILICWLIAGDIRGRPILLAPADPEHKKAAEVIALEECKTKLAELNKPESKTSLRRRTIRLAAEIDKFWNDQPTQPGGPPNNPVTDDEKKRVQVWEQYWRDRRAAYDSHGFQEKVAEIVGAYQTKNIPVGSLEWSIKYNRMIGGTMYRGDWETPPQVLCGTDTCLLRELAFHVNALDEVITPDF
jgi:hypothetical protein